jgi:tripartite-type tricarboxylate transporter receptor subunit TctC
MKRRTMMSMLAGLPAAAALTTAVRAQAYPSKPVKVIVPFTPGGSTDTSARIVAEGLTRLLGQQVLIDNKPGGRTIIGTEVVAKAPADGYTLLYAPATFSTNVAFDDKLPYDTAKDFVPVVRTVDMPMLFSCSMDAPYKTVRELLAWAKTAKAPIPYAAVGTGSSVHLWGEMIRLRSGLPMEHVSYKGSSDAMRDVMAGTVPLFTDVIVPGAAMVKAGKLRGLGIGTTERFRLLPDVPTMTEAGLPGLEATTPFGLVAPAGTPPEVVGRLNATVNQVFEDEAMRQKLLDLGFLPLGGTPDAYGKFLADEIVRWREVIREAKVPKPG